MHCLLPTYYIDEEVDAATLLMLGATGTTENMQQCGLTKVKEEMKFRKLKPDPEDTVST